MKYTKNQELAILHEGENILVSAGAGSGKTAVLTERVIKKLEKGIHIDDLIILTFTNAAAAEMKARIKTKILENRKLNEELKRLDNAVISTFDSFALRLVKEYHYLLSLPEEINIADSLILKNSTDHILDETLTNFYLSKDEQVLQTVDRLFDKGDQTFRDAILTLSLGVEAVPDKMDFLKNYEEHFFSEQFIQNCLEDFSAFLFEKVKEIKKVYDRLLQIVNFCKEPKVLDFIDGIKRSYEILFKEKTLDGLMTAFCSFSHPSFPRLSKEAEETWGQSLRPANEALKNILSETKETLSRLFVTDLITAKLAMVEPRKTILCVVKATISFIEKLDQFKKSHNLFDYNDIMNLAITLLEKFPEIVTKFKNRINEVLVDEYQDTNDLQDYMLSLLENDNLFLVGDIKQSIYGFRNANPRNFAQKYRDFDQSKKGKVIDLLENFRSRTTVLEGINQFFVTVMDEEFGGVNYQNRQALIYGNHLYDHFQSSLDDYKPEILTYDTEETEEGERLVNQSVSKAYREGTIIASDIRRKLSTGFRVFDLSTQSDRPAVFKDFAILVDRKSSFEDYEKALVDQGLPVFAQADEKFVASSEILFINNALCLLKCFADSTFFETHFSRALYGVSRSFVYEIPDEEIILQLIKSKNWTQQDLPKLAENPVFSEIYFQFKTVYERSLSLPLDSLLLDLYQTIGLIPKIATLPDPENVETKLLFLLQKAKELTGFSLENLILYFETLYREKDIDIEFSKPFEADANAVRLMTIHKSKGLEFPIVYFPGLDKKFNYSESKAFFIFDKHYGLITKAYDEGFKDTILHVLVKNKNYQDYVSERIRLFYVGLTRAKEKIILIQNNSKKKENFFSYENNGYLDRFIRRKYHCFLDIVNSVGECRNWEKTADESIFRVPFTSEKMEEDQTQILFKTIKIAGKVQEKGTFSKHSLQILTPQEKNAIAFGNNLHRELENFDFQNPQTSIVHLSPLVADAVYTLLSTPIFDQIDQAKIYQEYEFFDESSNESKHGIIDLIVERSDHFDIIDYKLKNLDDLGYELQLKGYQDFIEKTFLKPARIFLFSIEDRILRQIGG